jgi:hypothetical protein
VVQAKNADVFQRAWIFVGSKGDFAHVI